MDLARHDARWLVEVARREGLAREDALDAVQDAFATLVRLAGARQISEVAEERRGYLAALVRGRARNMRRRHHRARPHVPLEDEAPVAGPSAEELAARAEELSQAVACLAELTEVQRRVLDLRVLEELAGPEVARRLGLAPGHVAVLLHRARAALARCMEAAAGG